MEKTEDQIKVRKDKLAFLDEAGVALYPYAFDRSHTVEDFLAQFEDLAKSETKVTLAGRMVAKRVMGKASFAHVGDKTGKLQLYLQRDEMGIDNYTVFKKGDLGDWMGVEGVPFVTKTGENSLKVTAYTHLAKCLRPLPNMKEKDDQAFSALSDVEQRYRQRYVDLIVNPETRRTLEIRSQVAREIRNYLDDKEFLEIETPILQPLYGGANARPFVTHHNSLDAQFYLRISNELYLKRLMVGGMERVYEIGRYFRNEGIDRNHNPEFTAMEFYWAYNDYHAGMDMVEDFFRTMVQNIHGTTKITWGELDIDFGGSFNRVSMIEALKEKTGLDILEASDADLLEACRKHNVDVETKAGYGKLVDELFGALVEPELVQPTFVIDYPTAISPLAKKHRDYGDKVVERFELFIAGMEFGNAFSELNDPIDQRERLESQAKLREMGDDEANVVDEDFLNALEYGMPPTFGFGMGVDRFVMLMANQPNIKDVIAFPTLKPNH